jgi:protoheme IX farnesyltransferase
VVLWATGRLLAVPIAVASIFYYAVVYTVWLKRRTPQNIVIGGAAGASAPLIAWAAVTGAVSVPAVLLAGIVFLWTPPHFWALALVRREDYARAGIPMLPVTHGEAETRRQIVLYTLVLVPVTLGLVPLGVAGWIYGIPAALLGAGFILGALRLARAPGPARAMRLFGFSILYLFALYTLLTVDAVVRHVAGGGAIPGR